MAFGNESDDDLIVIEDGPKKTALPTDKEIDEKLRIWVDDEVQKGNDPKDMKLMLLIKVQNKFTGYIICSYKNDISEDAKML